MEDRQEYEKRIDQAVRDILNKIRDIPIRFEDHPAVYGKQVQIRLAADFVYQNVPAIVASLLAEAERAAESRIRAEIEPMVQKEVDERVAKQLPAAVERAVGAAFLGFLGRSAKD